MSERIGTVKRTGHWIACIDGRYLQRRSSQPVLVWDVRENASSFRTRREASAEVRRSGVQGHGVAIENVAQTHAGFLRWRGGG